MIWDLPKNDEHVQKHLKLLEHIARGIRAEDPDVRVEDEHGNVITSLTNGMSLIEERLFQIAFQLERIANALRKNQ
jgi:hypothetical protein